MSPMFEFREVENIPNLAWLAEVRRSNNVVKVTHGKSVEREYNRFFEGAWAGEFDEWAFDRSAAFGSGGLVAGDDILFIPPVHSLDRIFVRIEDDRVIVSNSMAFLLAKLGRSLRTDRSDYFKRYEEIVGGIENYKTEFLLDDGSSFFSWIWYGLRINRNLEIENFEKNYEAPFDDFKSYRNFLSSTMKKVFDNASSAQRKTQYLPLGSISSGYDSTAISALASELGCLEAFTFEQSRKKLFRKPEIDSGAEAAEKLGLSVQKVGRLEYREREAMSEIETYGVGSELLSARPQLVNKVFLSGQMGDTMWDRVPAVVSDKVAWTRAAGVNVGEFRLVTDFVYFPVPFLAAWRQRAIVKISQSEEMAPWRLNNNYDRPICRRIAEEKGIPRHSFGVKKRAAGVFFRDEGLKETMAPDAYQDYLRFRSMNSKTPLWLARLLSATVDLFRQVNSATRKLSIIVSTRTGLKIPVVKFPDSAGLRAEAALLFQWSIERQKEKFSDAL